MCAVHILQMYLCVEPVCAHLANAHFLLFVQLPATTAHANTTRAWQDAKMYKPTR